ncbi:MAG: DegT/DnrJ/EryC1/StrS family aminotransferase [Gemmatimonadota bacterium]
MTLPIPPAHSPVRGSEIIGAALAVASASRKEAEGALERALALRFHAMEVATCGSGTQALQLALTIAASARPRGSNPAVALPAYACFDLASAAIGSDSPVIFYDLDPVTLGPDLASVEAALARGAGVLVAAPLFGLPVAWEPLEILAHEHGVVLVEDAAQGGGGSWAGRLIGELGALSVLSFGRGKGWTGGGGGALLARGEMAGRLRHAKGARGAVSGWGGRAAVTTTAQWILGRPGLYAIPAAIPGLALGETMYHPPVPVRKMTKFSLQLARRTAESSATEAASRRACAFDLEARIAEVPGVSRVRPASGGEPGYLRLPVLVEGGSRALRDPGTARALGIMPGYPLALPELPALKGCILEPTSEMPVARRLAAELLTLPTHRFVTPKIAERIASALGGRKGDPPAHGFERPS